MKSRFLTFIFSLVPGVGQMYLGLMKRGCSLMGIFWGIIAIACIFPPICFTLPIIWFYSFFDAINYNSMPYDKKQLIKDSFIFDEFRGSFMGGKKMSTILGGLLIFIGAYAIFDGFIMQIFWDISNYIPFLGNIIRAIPTVVIAGVILVIGIYLVKSKDNKFEDYREDEFDENKFNH